MSTPLFDTLLRLMVDADASDLFLSAGRTPAMRIKGRVRSFAEPLLTPELLHQISNLVLNDAQRAHFERDLEANVAYVLPQEGRFRVNLFRQRREIGMVVRAVPRTILDLDALGLPPILKEVAMLKRGLVLLIGPAGTGKSTTMASMVNYRNIHDAAHIVTIEDPIEYEIPHHQSIINQREVSIDTHSYQEALENVLRQSPDVLVLGEIRSREVLEQALLFADTGHLCLATMHANNATQLFERIINFFPAERRDQILLGLSLNMRAVLSQRLIPTFSDNLVAATELLLQTPRVADLIRKGEFGELMDAIERGSTVGMQTLDQSLYNLLDNNLISPQTALEYAESFRNMRLRMRLSTTPVASNL
ncbi:MAG: PilT/PilU family type 4a pilus ATPase [Gammaproteobacteria bacterium]|nr:PilT/PilU family type 4a pilus ATPase [Gammaproteobacteria bacterium]